MDKLINLFITLVTVCETTHTRHNTEDIVVDSVDDAGGGW